MQLHLHTSTRILPSLPRIRITTCVILLMTTSPYTAQIAEFEGAV